MSMPFRAIRVLKIFLLGTSVLSVLYILARTTSVILAFTSFSIHGPLRRCSETSFDLVGRFSFSKEEYTEYIPAGEWKPRDCTAEQKVAIVLPYRNRAEHLKLFLSVLHPMLQRQKLHYRIFIIEQAGNDLFNRAKLLNIGFRTAVSTFGADCIVFHDVDLLPEDDRNFYNCSNLPRHLSVAIDEHFYKLRYPMLVGGVLGMKVEMFTFLNGFSNMYFGWGCEDDDMYWRMFHKNITVERPSEEVARYHMIQHKKRETEKFYKIRRKRYHTQRDRDISANDGINTLTYRIVSFHEQNLYTHVLVDVGHPPPNWTRRL